MGKKVSLKMQEGLYIFENSPSGTLKHWIKNRDTYYTLTLPSLSSGRGKG
jgi:hypothetical protein